jgi:hypothetical protein
MPKKSSASDPPITFQTTAPPPVLSLSHLGRVSLTVTWPHVYGISEDIKLYRVRLTPGPTVEVVAPNEGDVKAYTFTGLAMDYTYYIEVWPVNQPFGQPEAVGPPGVMRAHTLREWADPPGRGLDAWNGTVYTPGRTNFTYAKSGIFMNVDNWAQVPIKLGALNAPDGKTVDHKEGMSWIEFNVDVVPELQIVAFFLKAGHRWPQ